MSNKYAKLHDIIHIRDRFFFKNEKNLVYRTCYLLLKVIMHQLFFVVIKETFIECIFRQNFVIY